MFEFSSYYKFRGSKDVAGGVVRPPTASEPKGRQKINILDEKVYILCLSYFKLSR